MGEWGGIKGGMGKENGIGMEGGVSWEDRVGIEMGVMNVKR